MKPGDLNREVTGLVMIWDREILFTYIDTRISAGIYNRFRSCRRNEITTGECRVADIVDCHGRTGHRDYRDIIEVNLHRLGKQATFNSGERRVRDADILDRHFGNTVEFKRLAGIVRGDAVDEYVAEAGSGLVDRRDGLERSLDPIIEIEGDCVACYADHIDIVDMDISDNAAAAACAFET